MSDSLRVKDAVDIVRYLQSRFPALKKTGRLYKMCCPMHAEKTPSFTVNPETQQFKCYGACAHGGDVINFLMWHDGVTFGEALRTLADYGHVTLSPRTQAAMKTQVLDERRAGLLKTAANIYQANLNADWHSSSVARAYLTTERGLTSDTLKTFQIGYAPDDWQWLHRQLVALGYVGKELVDAGLCNEVEKDGVKTGQFYDRFRNRIMFPISDDRGQVRGFGARAMGDEMPKYLNSPASEAFTKSDLLYGLHRAKGAIRDSGRAIIVEGYMDAAQAHQAGILNVVAQMGTAFTANQMTALSRLTQTLVFALDSDTAGQAATRRIAEEHIASGIDLRLLAIANGKDPDDMIRQSPTAFTQAALSARSLVDVLIDIEVGTLTDDANVLQKQAILKRLMPRLTVPSNPLYTAENARKLTAALDLPIDAAPRPALTILARPERVSSMPSQVELMVLHNLIMKDEDRWLDRASARLLVASSDPMPYALAPLSSIDFPHPLAQRLMSLLCDAARADERPFDEYLEVRTRDTDVADLFKAVYTPPTLCPVFKADAPAVIEADDYDTFLEAVLQLRCDRLRADMAALNDMDSDEAIDRWMECSRALAYLEVYA